MRENAIEKLPENRFLRLKKPDFSCRKGLPGLWRGRYCIATRPPLQRESGPATTPGGPYGKTGDGKPAPESRRSVLKRNFYLSRIFA